MRDQLTTFVNSDSPVLLFVFGKIPCPVCLFRTVRLLDSPVYGRIKIFSKVMDCFFKFENNQTFLKLLKIRFGYY